MKYKDSEKQKLVDKVCTMMSGGLPCGKSCVKSGVPKSTFLGWVKAGGSFADQYASAREAMIHAIAEEVLAISDSEPVTIVDQHGISRYDSAAVQHQRLRVDSRKWLLSKMMPKVYGDKTTQEVTGANGGPLTITALDLKNLTDDELDNMDYLMSKGSTEAEVK
jgi:hypothetical protein